MIWKISLVNKNLELMTCYRKCKAVVSMNI